MIDLPVFEKAHEFENSFFLTCGTQRVSKFIAHYELYKRTIELPGHVVECGVFKGASLIRWAHFREMFGGAYNRRIVGFDTFGQFPSTSFEDDKKVLNKFIDSAGDQSIGVSQLQEVLSFKGCSEKVELIEGDILKTVPDYIAEHPELKISLLNIDTDIYEPAVCILENLYDRVVKGGVILLDDYGVFPGETKAVDDFLKSRKEEITIRKFSNAMTPSYIVKE